MRRKRKGAGIRDRFNFMLWLVEHGEEFDNALSKSELTLGESIFAHDYILTPQKRILTIRNSKGKRYRYEGKGHFRRIDSLGRKCIDGKSRHIDGAKRLGFVANPLKYALNGKEDK
jgi:hypothetical protein